MVPALDLGHDWQRSRQQARRGGRQRPPPLVAAGFDVAWQGGRQVKVGGLAIVFGAFPPTFADLVGFAKARLNLQPEQARQLDAVLNARLLGVWAWLPGAGRDLYLEYDRASGELGAWLLPAGDDQALDELDPTDPATAERFDPLLLEALVVNGNGGWGGAAGLRRLIERFGPQPLLVAAQIAGALGEGVTDPSGDPAAGEAMSAGMDLARNAWPGLGDDPASWPVDDDSVHPFVAGQLGRLALRCGMPAVADRLFLRGEARAPSAAELADHATALEILGDLVGAEARLARLAGGRPQDQEPWRRLLGVRVRLGRFVQASDALTRHRAAGGEDAQVVARVLLPLLHAPLKSGERAAVAGWLGGRLDAALDPLLDPLPSIIAARFPQDEGAAARAAHAALVQALHTHFAPVGPPGSQLVEARVRSLARVVAWTLPLMAPLHRTQLPDRTVLIHDCQRAIAWWCEQRLGLGLRWTGSAGWLGTWADLAVRSHP